MEMWLPVSSMKTKRPPSRPSVAARNASRSCTMRRRKSSEIGLVTCVADHTRSLRSAVPRCDALSSVAGTSPGQPLARHVKGTLFVDYVRMLRLRKDVAWSRYLRTEDLPLLSTRIEPQTWYPMESFERIGLAILDVIADGQLERVREFGRASVDWLALQHPQLVVDGDPRETLMRFHVMRQSFFDFPAIELRGITDGTAAISIAYQMGDVAEEAAAFQTMGFFERLLEVAFSRKVEASFTARSWAADAETVLELRWS
jgi:hypothetical protein